MTLTASPQERSRIARPRIKHVKNFLVVAALLWTLYNWEGLVQIKDKLHQIPWLVASFIIFEICFNVGLIMMAVGAGHEVFRGSGWNPRSWISSLGSVRQSMRALLNTDTTSPSYRWGLNLNWVGAAMTTGIIPMIAIALLLPFKDWSLMVIPVIDLFSTFIIRLSIKPKQRSAVA